MTRWKKGDVALVNGSVALVWGDSVTEQESFVYTDVDGDACDIYVYGPDARPLVVIDPEDREQVKRLMAAFERERGEACFSAEDNHLQAALRSLVAPPRIDEPGTWGVVEAACVHTDERAEWVRWSDGNWYRTNGSDVSAPDDWDSLVAPTLIREGVA